MAVSSHTFATWAGLWAQYAGLDRQLGEILIEAKDRRKDVFQGWMLGKIDYSLLGKKFLLSSSSMQIMLQEWSWEKRNGRRELRVSEGFCKISCCKVEFKKTFEEQESLYVLKSVFVNLDRNDLPHKSKRLGVLL